MPLRCPTCGREGKAEMSENDGYSFAFGAAETRVDSIPEGFKAATGPGKKVGDFVCVTCNVEAV